MNFSPFKGWIRNGPDFKSNLKGLRVLADKPKQPATPVVVLTLEHYEELISHAAKNKNPA